MVVLVYCESRVSIVVPAGPPPPPITRSARVSTVRWLGAMVVSLVLALRSVFSSLMVGSDIKWFDVSL